MDLTTFLIRITICFALSILIGLERQLRHRMVGLRTNVLVCIGAFLFVYFAFGFDIGNSDITIGTLCAAGLVVEATIGTAFVLLSNVILRLISLFIMNKLKATEKEKYTIRINCKKTKEEKVRTNFAKIIDNNDLVLNSLERSEITEDEIKLKAIMITSTPSKVEMVINEISTNPGIVSVTWEHEKISKSDNEDSDEE